VRVAIVYNRQSQRVINLFGLPNREKYGLKAIKRISDALKKGGHQVAAFEGDKDLIDRLEEFMPRVVKGERPGMVFNLSYGIQGQARYTHVPGMLEMIGLPYIGSGPLAHSLALDKVVSKMIFVQRGVPTPEFAVLDGPGFDVPDLKFPLIVKPKNEAVSFGIKIVENEAELREASDLIFKEFAQPVLVERYIGGREINVGLLGNHPTEALPPAEILFGEGGPKIYTWEDKTRRSGREIAVECPANISKELTQKAQDIALRAFKELGCFDCARVDMRLDENDNLYVLEINSLPSLGEHGSYVQGAAAVGLDFAGLVNRLVDVAATRYFGFPSPPEVSPDVSDSDQKIFNYLSTRRDEIENQISIWTRIRSRTNDPIGVEDAHQRLNDELTKLGLKENSDLVDDRVAWTWETHAGLENGTLLIGHLDVPIEADMATPRYRREPEWLFGEGIGTSRAPLVSMLSALRALKRVGKLRKIPLGILYYADEGRDARYSVDIIEKAVAKSKQVLVLRPGNVGNNIVTARRGQRLYRVVFDGEGLRPGKSARKPEVLSWAFQRLQNCFRLSSKKDRVSVSAIDFSTVHMPMLLPHQATAILLVSYPDEKAADQLELQIKEILQPKGVETSLKLISKRPPIKERAANARLAKSIESLAAKYDIPLKRESSVWPSVGGLVPAKSGVICAMGPVARNINTPDESVDRISLIQRTILLAEFLNQQV
jgi:D-alanine-D-alanine ligase